MGNVRRSKGAVVEAAGRFRGVAAVEAGYQHFRLERQGALLAQNTLLWYDRMVLPFLAGWARRTSSASRTWTPGSCGRTGPGWLPAGRARPAAGAEDAA